MSLQRLAHRICTVAALRGRTLAGDMVTDSTIPPIESLAADGERPFVCVYTDDGSGPWRGINDGTASPSLSIVLEIGVSSRMDEGEGWGIPVTDAGMEITLDVIERQIENALNDEANPWAEMWRRLHHGDPKVTSSRGASAEKGVRFAGRQIVIEVEPYREPPFGPEPGPLWTDFIAMLAAEPELAWLADVVRPLILTDPPPAAWVADRRAYGMDDREVASLLLGQPEGASPETLFADARLAFEGDEP